MRCGVAMLVALATAMLIAPAALPAEPPQDDVAGWIARLSSSRRGERVEAERALAEGDLGILARLPQREDVSDPAVQLALDRIRARLRERRALQDASPTMIDGRQVETVGDLVDASHSQFVVIKEIAAKKIHLPDKRLSLWEAVDDVAAQLDLRLVVSEKIRLGERAPDVQERAIAYSGAFHVLAAPIRLRKIAGSDRERLARLSLEVQAEPRLRPLFVSYASKEIALTAGEESLPPFSPEARVEIPLGEGKRAVGFPLDFVARREMTSPFSLSGRVTATVAAGEERFAFPLVDSQAAKRSQAGVTVELHKFEKNGDGGAIAELSVVYDEGGPAFESHRTWVYHNQAYLTFKSASRGERKLRRNHEPGFSTLAISSGGVKLGYRFADLPTDAKDIVFNYEAPTKIVNVPVTFKMEGVRLQEKPGGGA